MASIKTSWKINNVKKSNSEDEYTEIEFTDYRGKWTVKLENPRHLVQDLDKYANYKGI